MIYPNVHIKVPDNYTTSILKSFCKDFSLPIQIHTPEFMEYYINLYDAYYETKFKFMELRNTINKFDSLEGFESYKQKFTDSIIDRMKESNVYNELLNCDVEAKYPIEKEVGGITFSKSVEKLYNPTNSGNYYISIDLRRANFQALKYHNPEIVFNSDEYEELLDVLGCQYDYFKLSKYIRQVIFGNLDMKKIPRIERYITQNILIYIINHCQNYINRDNIEVFTTDEIIIHCSEQNWYDENKLYQLKQLIEENTNSNVHVENYRLKYIGNNFYLKEHLNDMPTFKGGSSIYFPQAFKHVEGMDLNERDLCFNYEGHIAMFKEPLIWE